MRIFLNYCLMKPIHSLLFYVLIIAILVLHFSCQSEIKTPTSEVPSANSNFGLSPYLLEAATLNLEYRSHSKLLDVRKKEAYEEGHLAGAIQVWRSDICRLGFEYSGLRSSKDSLALFLKKIGVQMQDSIILYDAKGNPDAARLWGGPSPSWVDGRGGSQHRRYLLCSAGSDHHMDPSEREAVTFGRDGPVQAHETMSTTCIDKVHISNDLEMHHAPPLFPSRSGARGPPAAENPPQRGRLRAGSLAHPARSATCQLKHTLN